jgi:hypothetical protein
MGSMGWTRGAALAGPLRSTPNRIAASVTLAAVAAVGLWSTRPMSGAWTYGAAESGPASVRHPVVWSGFSRAEPWGRWTTGHDASIEFDRPLPNPAAVTIRAHAFGPNAGAPIRVCTGRDCATATFTDIDGDVTVELASGGARVIVIHVPHPMAPGNGDARTLGLAVSTVTIEEI